jgi:hypothetical protein
MNVKVAIGGGGIYIYIYIYIYVCNVVGESRMLCGVKM